MLLLVVILLCKQRVMSLLSPLNKIVNIFTKKKKAALDFSPVAV